MNDFITKYLYWVYDFRALIKSGLTRANNKRQNIFRVLYGRIKGNYHYFLVVLFIHQFTSGFNI